MDDGRLGRGARGSVSGRYDGGMATLALPWAADVRPVQFYPTRHVQPELRLMLAVLEDARHVLLKYDRDHREWRLAAEWVQSAEAVWPFSFLSICEAVGFEAQKVRTAFFSDGEDQKKRLRVVRSHHKARALALTHAGARAHGAF